MRWLIFSKIILIILFLTPIMLIVNKNKLGSNRFFSFNIIKCKKYSGKCNCSNNNCCQLEQISQKAK